MAADPKILVNAIQLLFMAYVLFVSNIAADRTTFILAFDLVCVAKFFSWGIVLVLENIIIVLVPRNRGDFKRILKATVGIVISLIVNLYFISRFVQQLHPGAPAIDVDIVRKRHVAMMLFSLWLLASGFLLGAWYHLLSMRPTNREDSRRRLRKFWFMVAQLFDIFLCLVLALASHIVFWKILNTVGPPGNTSEAITLMRMDEISKIRTISGWLLAVRDTYVSALVELQFARFGMH